MTWIHLVSLFLIPSTIVASTYFAAAMRRRSIGQQVREIGPRSHLTKSGTPTMGGVVVLGLWLAAVLLVHRGPWATHGFVLAAACGFALIGAIDDLLSLRRRHSMGLGGWQKIGLAILVSVAIGLAFPEVLSIAYRIPFTDLNIMLPWGANLALFTFVFVSTTNGTNLTDGLDGLASGSALITTIGLLLLAGTSAVGSLLLPLIAVLIGFLWINTHPAGLFLGDVGSFGLGGLLAAVAMVTGSVLFLPLVAGVMVIETVSVALQVSWFRLRGRRIFKMAPLHHHFEAGERENVSPIVPSPGWPEERVTMRFWILQAVFVGIALLAAR